MNPIHKVAQFNNHLAWWWGSLLSDRFCTDQHWALSSGSRIASLMIGLNFISAVLLLEKITNLRINSILTFIIVSTAMVVVHTVAIGQEMHDISSIKTYTQKRKRNIKINSMVYFTATLVVLITVVCTCI